MKIPRQFKLLGHVYKVTVVPKTEWAMEDAVAFLDDTNRQICILKTSKQMQEHSYLHEAVHAILNAMGRDKLSKDEAFVDTFSGMLHQVLTEAK